MTTHNTETKPDTAAASGRVQRLVQSLISETVMGDPSICQEEWDCIESVIAKELNRAMTREVELVGLLREARREAEELREDMRHHITEGPCLFSWENS